MVYNDRIEKRNNWIQIKNNQLKTTQKSKRWQYLSKRSSDISF